MIASNDKSEQEVASKPSVAVFYPHLAGGGAESVVLWILEALKHRYQVTLFTLFDVDVQRLNAGYGTQLSSETVTVKSILPRAVQNSLQFLIVNNNT